MRHKAKTEILYIIILGVGLGVLNRINNEIDLLKLISFGIFYIIVNKLFKKEMDEAEDHDYYELTGELPEKYYKKDN